VIHGDVNPSIGARRCGTRCWYCGDVDDPMTRDRLTPACQGGEYVPGNVVPACRACNSRKGRRNLEEYRSKLGRPTFYGETHPIEAPDYYWGRAVVACAECGFTVTLKYDRVWDQLYAIGWRWCNWQVEPDHSLTWRRWACPECGSRARVEFRKAMEEIGVIFDEDGHVSGLRSSSGDDCFRYARIHRGTC